MCGDTLHDVVSIVNGEEKMWAYVLDDLAHTRGGNSPTTEHLRCILSGLPASFRHEPGVRSDQLTIEKKTEADKAYCLSNAIGPASLSDCSS
jgi:hypothetical protein